MCECECFPSCHKHSRGRTFLYLSTLPLLFLALSLCLSLLVYPHYQNQGTLPVRRMRWDKMDGWDCSRRWC